MERVRLYANHRFRLDAIYYHERRYAYHIAGTWSLRRFGAEAYYILPNRIAPEEYRMQPDGSLLIHEHQHREYPGEAALRSLRPCGKPGRKTRL